MNYHYLQDEDIIEFGDEFIDENDELGWWVFHKTGRNIGWSVKQFKDVFGPGIIKVRRPIKITKKGNHL